MGWKRDHEAACEAQLGRSGVPEVGGTFHACGVGEVVGMEVTKPMRVLPGTKVFASGVGKITGVKI